MEYVRAVLQKLGVATSNEELGRKASLYPEDETGRPRRSTQVDIEEPNAVIEASDDLREFRMLVGITTHPSFKAPRGYNANVLPVVTTKGRPAPNLGIYPTVVSKEFKTKRNYKRFSNLINSCLGLQIIVAAALTALGAADGNHHAITVFGAINTVIAGFLTYLKGSGLPMRFKFYAHEWSKVREYIEQKERDLGAAQHGIDVLKEVNIIRKMYEEVKADIEANTPDRFVSSTGSNKASPVQGPAPALGTEEKDEKSSDASESSGSGLASMTTSIAAMRTKLESQMKNVEAMEQGIHARATAEKKKVMIVSEKEAATLEQDRAKETGDLEKNLDL